MEKSAHKLELLRRIADLEKKELWHLDVEDDPETYPLMPDKIKADRDERNRLIYKYSRYDEQNPNFREQGEIILPAEQGLHIPGLGFDGLVGYSPIAMAKNAIGLKLFIAKSATL